MEASSVPSGTGNTDAEDVTKLALTSLLTSGANFPPAAAPLPSSMAPLATDSSKIGTSGTSLSAETLAQDVSEVALPLCTSDMYDWEITEIIKALAGVAANELIVTHKSKI